MRYGGWTPEKDVSEANRRSVYVFEKRTMTYPMFEAFDAPNPQDSCPRRFRTVIPSQSLQLMNDGLVLKWSQALASRVQTMQGFHLVMNLALFPLLFFSGAFYPTNGLPAWLEVLARANPLTYAVDALQLATYADSSAGFIGLGIDLDVLVVLAGAVYALGLTRLPRLTWSGR